MVLLIMVVAFVLERTLRLIREVDPSVLPLDLLLGLLACKVPEVVGIALPFAFFAGILLTFQRLVRDRELDVIYASGLGLMRLMRPLLFLTMGAVVLSIIVFWFLSPHARYEFSVLLHKAAQAAISAPLKMGSFVQLDGKVLYVQPDASGGGGEIFLYERDPNGHRFVTTAVAEDFEISRDKRSLFFSAREGSRLSIPAHGRQPTLMTFKHVREVIHSVDRKAFRCRGENALELTLPELLAVSHQAVTAQPASIQAQVHSKLARVLFIVLLPLVAVPLAIGFPVARQWIAIAIGVFLVLALDQALIFAETVVGLGQASPWLPIWGALAGFAAIGTVLCAIVGTRTSRGRW